MTASIAHLPCERDVLKLAEAMRKVGMKDHIKQLGGDADFTPAGFVDNESVEGEEATLPHALFTLREPHQQWSVEVVWQSDGQRRITWCSEPIHESHIG